MTSVKLHTNHPKHASSHDLGYRIHYPFWYGGLASMVAGAVTHPLDLAKVRMQTALAREKTMFGTMLHVAKEQGISGLYKGLSASLLRQATYSTTRFALYEELKERMSNSKGDPPSFTILIGISMISGMLGGFIGNPADVANIRMQNDASLPIQNRRNYKNVFHALIRMVKEEGLSSLFRGLIPNSTRGVLMTASQMVSYDEFKKFFVNTFNFNPEAKYTHFASSLGAGLVATTVCSPVDVVKTRIMNAAKSNSTITSSTSASTSTFKIISEMVRKEGLVFLFRGWVPAFCRLGPQTIVTFLVLEQLRSWGIGSYIDKPRN